MRHSEVVQFVLVVNVAILDQVHSQFTCRFLDGGLFGRVFIQTFYSFIDPICIKGYWVLRLDIDGTLIVKVILYNINIYMTQ